MGYEEDAKELMEKFKSQFSQTQNQTQNINLSEIYKKENEGEQIKSVNQNDILNTMNSSNLPTDQSPPDQDISNVINSQNSQSTDQSPPDQEISMVVNNIQSESQPSASIPSGANVCPQCKLIHPPLKPGQKCPNVSEDLTSFGLDDASVNKFIVNMRDIVISQLEKKGIKDGSKFFQFAIIESMKLLEAYNEQ